jgi:CDP-diacylglycerol--glycerol-3-phosphate 3-phosphatidyltransferase
MTVTEDSGLDVWTDPAAERLGTPANVLTVVRTAVAVALAGWAAGEGDLGLLVRSLAVYWVGDVADGLVARYGRCETRIGAVLDILCDRFCAAAFYLGLVWLHPEHALPVLVYLAEFMVVDCFLSLAFLAWPIRSPNYFYVVDRTIWVWNWSKPAKAANSAIFAVLLLTTGWTWLALAAASALLVVKSVSVVRLVRVGLPVPGGAGAIG